MTLQPASPVEDFGDADPRVALWTLIGGFVALIVGAVLLRVGPGGAVRPVAAIVTVVGALDLVGWIFWFRLSRGRNLQNAARAASRMYRQHERRVHGSPDPVLPPAPPRPIVPISAGRTHRACVSCGQLFPAADPTCPFCGAPQP